MGLFFFFLFSSRLLELFEPKGPESFLTPMGLTLLAHINVTYAELKQNWERIMRRAKHSKFKTIIAEYVRKLVRHITTRTPRTLVYHKAFDRYTIFPKITLIRHVTDDDFREVDEWAEQANIYELGSSGSVERAEAFQKEKYEFEVKYRGRPTTTPIIATFTKVNTLLSTCLHFALDTEYSFWEFFWKIFRSVKPRSCTHFACHRSFDDYFGLKPYPCRSGDMLDRVSNAIPHLMKMEMLPSVENRFLEIVLSERTTAFCTETKIHLILVSLLTCRYINVGLNIVYCL